MRIFDGDVAEKAGVDLLSGWLIVRFCLHDRGIRLLPVSASLTWPLESIRLMLADTSF